MNHRRAIAIAATTLISLASVSSTALALSSTTTGGYAYNSGTTRIYACDTSDDGHQIEAQGWVNSGERILSRDNAGGSCSSVSTSNRINRFRACRLEIFDSCGPMRYI